MPCLFCFAFACDVSRHHRNDVKSLGFIGQYGLMQFSVDIYGPSCKISGQGVSNYNENMRTSVNVIDVLDTECCVYILKTVLRMNVE